MPQADQFRQLLIADVALSMKVVKAHARTRNPFGRLTTPEDVANVIFLLSLPEAAWVTGEVIRVDGGEAGSGLSR